MKWGLVEIGPFLNTFRFITFSRSGQMIKRKLGQIILFTYVHKKTTRLGKGMNNLVVHYMYT